MTFLQYFSAGAGVTLGVVSVVLAAVIILGLYDKLKELITLARALRKKGG